MKAKKIIYALSLAAMLGMTSCGSDFLNTPTDSRVELDTTEKLRMLLVSSYPNGNYGWPCEIMTDNIEDNNAPDADGLRYNLGAYNRGDEEMFRWELCVNNTGTDSPTGIWQSNYSAIAGANAVLEVLEKWEKQGPLDSKQKAIKGEALLIRSYCHFMLAQVFCRPYSGESLSKNMLGIPYIKKPETTVKPHYERGTLDACYAEIEKDLELGLQLVSDDIYEVPKYHFNVTAAHAYAARFYLITRKYDKCVEHCDAVFGTTDPGSYLSDFYAKAGDFYSTIEMGKYQQGADKPWNLLLIPTYSTAMRHFYGGCRFGIIRDALNATIHSTGPSWARWKYYNPGKNDGEFHMHPCYNGFLYINGKSEYGLWTPQNICEQFEYTDKLAGIGYPHLTRSEFTAEEVLLTRAEAYAFLGEFDKSLADLTIWENNRRKTPNISEKEKEDFVDLTVPRLVAFYVNGNPGSGIVKEIHIDEVCPSDYSITSDEMLALVQCVQHFRRIEFIHNGMRWFDIKRLGLEFDRKIGKDEEDHLGIHDERKAMQIPAEIQAAGMQPNYRVDPSTIQKDNKYEIAPN